MWILITKFIIIPKKKKTNLSNVYVKFKDNSYKIQSGIHTFQNTILAFFNYYF